MDPNDVDIDTWLFEADRDLEASTPAEIDVEAMLAQVKQHATAGAWSPEGQHLSLDAVTAFVNGELSPNAHARAAAHVAQCGICATEIETVRRHATGRPLPEQSPMPADSTSVPPSAQDAHEPLPIYEAALSSWFGAASTQSQAVDAAEPSGVVASSAGDWTSPTDEGWQAAQGLLSGDHAKTRTASGLPKRAPKSSTSAPPLPPPTATTQRDLADAVRARFSSWQKGLHAAADAMSDPSLDEEAQATMGSYRNAKAEYGERDTAGSRINAPHPAAQDSAIRDYGNPSGNGPNQFDITTREEFIRALNQLRQSKGLSYKQVSDNTGDLALPKSTAHALCTFRFPKREDQLRAFLVGCGETAETLENWVDRWRRVNTGSQRSVSPRGDLLVMEARSGSK
ncbi:hypothetical protein ACIA8G_35445 [Lentzea sp. NPDC051213]|uniref:hypothetical protein n=1 Tax=Lentzea sp. NPDC051213 TaxID=3364126 RepID=UPI00379369C2